MRAQRIDAAAGPLQPSPGQRSRAAQRTDRAPTIQEAAAPRPPSDRMIPSGLAALVASLRAFATVSEILRMLGAAIVLASMSLFVFQGWDAGNDVQRYLLLLTQTGLLAGAGFGLGYGLREARGARVFFGLALISVPANFAILGALVYSLLQWDHAPATYPAFATWTVADLAGLGVVVAGAGVALSAVAFFCFLVMARPAARALTLSFLPLNALLLVPVRDSLLAGSVALGGALLAFWAARRLGRAAAATRTALATGEGRFALALLFLPPAIVLGRSLSFYAVDSFLVAMLAGAGFLALRQASAPVPADARPRRLAVLGEALSLPLALVTAVALAATFETLPFAALAPLAGLAYAALATDVLRRSASPALRGLATLSIGCAVFAGFGLSVLATPTALTTVAAILAGLALGLAGAWLGSITTMLAGIATSVLGTAVGFDTLVALVGTADWITLAVTGAAVIALGSVLERHGLAMKRSVLSLAGAWDSSVPEHRSDGPEPPDRHRRD